MSYALDIVPTLRVGMQPGRAARPGDLTTTVKRVLNPFYVPTRSARTGTQLRNS